MDFIKSILRYFQNREEVDGMILFQHEMSDDGTKRLITVMADPTGLIIMAIFTPEEWQMVCDVVELTGQDAEEVIRGLVEEGTIATIELDPKEF
jgi:hypothetical protein